MAFTDTKSQVATTWVPIHDYSGSTIAHVDSTGSIANQYTYDPAGATSVTGAAVPDLFLFGGLEQDPTGLYFSPSGYYSPRLERSVSGVGVTGASGGGNGLAGQAASMPGSSGGWGAPQIGVNVGAGVVAAAGIAASASSAAAILASDGIATAGFGPPGWIAYGVALAVVGILDALDFFGGSDQPWINPKLYAQPHSIQGPLLGVEDQVPLGQERVQVVELQAPGPAPTPYPNGSSTLDTYLQDWQCTVQGRIGKRMNANPCVVNCCVMHDFCYQENECNDSSWRSILNGDYSCTKCNRAAVGCIRRCF